MRVFSFEFILNTVKSGSPVSSQVDQWNYSMLTYKHQQLQTFDEPSITTYGKALNSWEEQR